MVVRARLIQRLNEGSGRKLTLISAPAGFGKTTLASAWLAGCNHRVAWLSLDEGDNDLGRFLIYLIAALRTISDVGEGVSGALQSPQPPPPEAILITLLNEINALPDRVTLVLDDYHVIDAGPVDYAVAFLVEHLPPRLHLVITTREDPQLPLARYRAQGQLTELRSADLRFAPDEAAEFLNQVMDLDLSAENIAALETRTEGWIAGLQLAALSMQGRSDAARFVQAFTGSHRFVLDYLLEEVLQRQPAPVRSFLLQTAILDRLSSSLCDAVTRRNDSRIMLDTLERGNLFVVPLDDNRQWYRYHHLFADVLQSRLMEEQPHQASSLHRRASAWYEQHQLPSDAIRHALAAGDFDHAADLIELAWSDMDVSQQSATWLRWAEALPDEVVRVRPGLSVGYAWALLDSGEMEACETRLQDAERWLDLSADTRTRSEAPLNELVVADQKLFRSLPATIATARTYRALALGDVAAAVDYAQQAHNLTPQEDEVRRIQVAALLGIARYANGELEAADRSLTDFLASIQGTADLSVIIGITFSLADIRMARGRLHEAASTYEQALRRAASQGEPLPVGTADLYRGLSELYREWDDLTTAAQHLQTGRELGEQAALTGWRHRLCVAEATIRAAQGDLDGALHLLDEAEQLYVRSPLPDVHPVAALRARIWIAQGKLMEAQAWARDRGLSVDDELSYRREFEHITLARLLIARYRRERQAETAHDVLGFLRRLQTAAEAGGRTGSVIELRVLQALAHEAQGSTSLALTALERALVLAEPEGYVRIFVDEGAPMAALLTRIMARGGSQKGYAYRLLAAFEKPGGVISTWSVPRPGATDLIEPLSERELDVLRLLGTELDGPEIARELMVSLSTIRTHTQNIYTKLGVNNRRAAIRRAEELHLL